MPDEDKWTFLSRDAAWSLSGTQWLDMAWTLATREQVRGQTRVVSTQNGAWRISCDSMDTIASLLPYGRILAKLHALHDIRPLPPVRELSPMPPLDFGKPLTMLRNIPWKEMPEELWRRYAWRMAVDAETAETTEIATIQNGNWHIRCRSQHAWNFLQFPQPVLGMLAWFSKMRPLPAAKAITPILAELPTENRAESAQIPFVDDDPDIPASIASPELRRILANLRPKNRSNA